MSVKSIKTLRFKYISKSLDDNNRTINDLVFDNDIQKYKQGIYRIKNNDKSKIKFKYYYIKDNKQISDDDKIRVNNLDLAPEYRDVWVSEDPTSEFQATYIDVDNKNYMKILYDPDNKNAKLVNTKKDTEECCKTFMNVLKIVSYVYFFLVFISVLYLLMSVSNYETMKNTICNTNYDHIDISRYNLTDNDKNITIYTPVYQIQKSSIFYSLNASERFDLHAKIMQPNIC
jgi:hypothetical protein